MKKRVLILCTGNSCRSQMAEGVLRHYGGSQYEVFSAGTKPSSVNSIAIQVMKEIGIDISGHRSKHVDEFKGQTFDYVITVCDNASKSLSSFYQRRLGQSWFPFRFKLMKTMAKESCPFFPGNTKRLHWEFPDPPHDKEITESVIEEFRKVRDMIRAKFKTAAEEGFE